jgi:DNA-binding response OmpR family regulator
MANSLEQVSLSDRMTLSYPRKTTKQGTARNPKPKKVWDLVIAYGDEYLLEDLTVRLGRSGFHVRGATCGITCLAMLRNRAPDGLLLDSELLWGGFDGVLEIMSEDTRLRSMPVIRLESARSDSHLRPFEAFTSSNILRLPMATDEMADRCLSVLCP